MQDAPINEARSYHTPYTISDYRFSSDGRVQTLMFDNDYMSIHLIDGRILLVPLQWIPSLRDAEPEDREKYHISADGTGILWDPDEGSVNEVLRVADYLSAC